jgi:uncharacterized protein YndB with AHSA1/START domain/predicted enzyme related to lactoylglutathione lyase
MKAKVASPNTLIVKRLIKVPRERVFGLWTKPDELMKWFGPETCRALSAKLDVRAGGNYQIRVRSEVMGEVDVQGVYREVNPPSRLAFTWKWSGHPQLDFGETFVAVDFLAVEGGTDVHITHERLPNAALRDDHDYGWNGCLDKLEKHLGLPCRERPALGSFCWNELLTNDVSAAAKFYTQLLDWQAVEAPLEGFKYTLFKKHDREVGGLMAVPAPQVPPHWLAHVHVANVDAIAQKAPLLGGKVLTPPFDVPAVGRVAVIQDPQGAVFGVFKPSSP